MYETKTYEQIKENILKNIIDLDKREGSFINDMVSPVSMELEAVYQEFNKMLGIMFLKDSAGEYIEKRANEYGLSRKKGTYATGYVTFTGLENTVIPKGSLVSTTTHLFYTTTQEAVILKGETQVDVPIRAEEIGDKYNVLSHSITQIPVAITGITYADNKQVLLGGTDEESDKELVSRVLLQIQNPATSGNAMHYKQWALEVEGVGNAKVFPLFNGNGTVMVMPITSDKRSPNESIIKEVIYNIEAKKPIGATVNVVSPKEIFINVEANIILHANCKIEEIKKKYTKKLKEYISDSVFKLYVIDYYKCLSLMYEIEGIKQVLDFRLNNKASNIPIQETEIQVTGSVTLKDQEG